MRLDDIRIPMRAVFPDSFLCIEINIDDAESFVVAETPLEVVEQRPEIITGDVHAFVIQSDTACKCCAT